LFSSLLCVHGAGSGRRWTWALLTFVNFLCLFYFELVFVVFVTLTGALYTVGLYWRTPRTVGRMAAVAVGGGLTSVGIFFGQLVAYMGMQGVLQDAFFTLKARNFAGQGLAPGKMLDFYERHCVIFWTNFSDGRHYLSAAACWSSFFAWNLGPYTPLLAVVVLIVVVGLLAGLLPNGLGRSMWHFVLRRVGPCNLARSTLRPGGRLVLGLGVFVGLSLCCDHFLAAVMRDRAYAGCTPEPVSLLNAKPLIAWLVHAAALGLCLLIGRSATNRWWGFARLPLARFAAAGIMLFACTWLLRHQHEWYDHRYEPFWDVVRRTWYISVSARLSVVVAGGVACVLVLRGRRLLGRETCRRLQRVSRYLVCGLIAYGVVYLLFPGYLHTGYLTRYVSFAVFFTNVLLAIACYGLGQLFCGRLIRGLRLARLANRLSRLPRRVAWPGGWAGSLRLLARAVSLAPVVAPGVLLAFMALYWVRLQVLYVRAAPPDYYSFLRTLQSPPYRGASFLTNAYALPVAAATGQWAYKDELLAMGRGQLGSTGYLVERDLRGYLWLADKGTNAAYAKPDYLLIVRQPQLTQLVGQLAPDVLPADRPTLAEPFVSAKAPHYLHPQVVAQDPSGRDRWLILKADWDYPPYLVPLAEGNPRRCVQLMVTTDSSCTEVRVAYHYAHQQGNPECGTIVRLYAASPSGGHSLLAEQQGQSIFRLPPSFAGNLEASVLPSTSTKRGPEFWSATCRVGNVPSLQLPYLKPLPDRADGCYVRLDDGTDLRGDLGRVDYVYAQDEHEAECGTLRRLYLEDEVGRLTLLQEVTGNESFQLPPRLQIPPRPSYRLRASVTPRTALAAGSEYFSADGIPLASLYRPFLLSLGGPNSACVGVELHRQGTCTELTIRYEFRQPLGAPESGTIIRLYEIDPQGTRTLLREEKDIRVLLLEPEFKGQVRVSVTPGSRNSTGPEYFSDEVSVGELGR
jgi:hypothetical protein